MFRTIIWFIYFWLYQLALVPILIWLKNQPAEVQTRIATEKAKNWSKKLLALAGAKVEVSGAENIPQNGAVLFVCNHQGAFDIPLMIAYLTKPFGFIAKDDLSKLPLINRWMKMLKCVFIKRNNPREAIKAISRGVETLKKEHSLLIFPEGTRSKDGNLLPFKAGSLRLAVKANVSIIPITIKGSKNLMKKSSFIIQPADVKIVIHPAVSVDTYEKDTHQIASALKQIIASQLS